MDEADQKLTKKPPTKMNETKSLWSNQEIQKSYKHVNNSENNNYPSIDIGEDTIKLSKELIDIVDDNRERKSLESRE